MAFATQKRFPLVFVLLPLLAVLGGVGVIGWNMYREFLRTEAEDDEARQQLVTAQAQKVEVAKAQIAEQHPVVEDQEDQLGNLPGQRKKPKPVVINQKPAQKSYLGFRAAYEKLENANENAARKFRARKLQIDDQYRDGKPTNEPKFIADCDSMKEQLLELLRNPENQ